MGLVPGERMAVRAYDYYEADPVECGKASRACAFMLRGVCATFMDLAYGGEYDATGQSGLRTFRCDEVKGTECGDD